ncbi:MAG: 3-oxoacyl-[acyl-carrier-protein] reductase [bacterium]
MANLLAGKVAIITGGTKGIGKAITLKFAQEGAKVVINYAHDDQEAKKTEEEIRTIGQEVLLVKGSVSDWLAVERMIKETINKWKQIDILVNNAGGTRDGFLMTMSDKNWDEVIELNLKGTYYCCKAVLKTMISQKSGKIINMSSLTGITGQIGQTNYAAAKGGIISFTKALAREVGRFGIYANTVVPGFIDTEMIRKLHPEIIEMHIELTPLGRLGKPEEVADVALFLASDMSSYITGQIIHVNGGEYM